MKRLVLAATLAVSVGGCSFMMVKPSAVQPLDAANCTDDYFWPVVDTAAGIAAGSAAIYAAQRSYANMPRDSLGREDALVGYSFIGAFYAGSAAVGYERVKMCRYAKMEAAARSP